MSDSASHPNLLSAVRRGNPDAAAILVRLYEPEIRRAVRVRLTDPRLRRNFDSADVCQSVLANFFVRVSAGEFDLNRPEQLLQLLVSMAKNKLLDKIRRQHAEKRDVRRLEGADTMRLDELQSRSADPAKIATQRDLLTAVRRLLSDEERRIADQRSLGKEWAEIAAEDGGSPEALRKKLSRGLDRVMRQLGIEGADDE